MYGAVVENRCLRCMELRSAGCLCEKRKQRRAHFLFSHARSCLTLAVKVHVGDTGYVTLPCLEGTTRVKDLSKTIAKVNNLMLDIEVGASQMSLVSTNREALDDDCVVSSCLSNLEDLFYIDLNDALKPLVPLREAILLSPLIGDSPNPSEEESSVLSTKRSCGDTQESLSEIEEKNATEDKSTPRGESGSISTPSDLELENFLERDEDLHCVTPPSENRNRAATAESDELYKRCLERRRQKHQSRERKSLKSRRRTTTSQSKKGKQGDYTSTSEAGAPRPQNNNEPELENKDKVEIAAQDKPHRARHTPPSKPQKASQRTSKKQGRRGRARGVKQRGKHATRGTSAVYYKRQPTKTLKHVTRLPKICKRKPKAAPVPMLPPSKPTGPGPGNGMAHVLPSDAELHTPRIITDGVLCTPQRPSSREAAERHAGRQHRSVVTNAEW